MCGRYTIKAPPQRIAEAVSPVRVDFAGELLGHRFNVAPSQAVPVVRVADGAGELAALEWGLLPTWAKSLKGMQRPINARAETVASNGIFRGPLRKRRCLLLADGFYEWKRSDAGKQPFHIRRPDDEPFAFAGLWDRWGRGADAVESCALITTEPNDVMRPIHDRMPVILTKRSAAAWLDAEADVDHLLGLLRPYAGKLEAYPVSVRVNSPRNDEAANVEPVG